MEHIRSVTREFPTGPNAVLHLEARSGSVEVSGRSADSVSVEAIVRVWSDLGADADDAVAEVERGMEQDAHRVIVRAPQLQHKDGWSVGALFGQHSSRVDYRVRVPTRTAVRVLSRSGNVEISGVEGVVHSEVLSGKLNISEVRGDITLSSRSGSVQAERILGSVVGEVRSGKVVLRALTGGVQLESRSGSVELADIGGDVRLTASSGGITIDSACGQVYVRARAGSVRFKGRVHHDVDIEAVAGSITMAVDDMHPFFVDAKAQAGSVTSDLAPRSGRSAPAAGGPKVRLRTRAGSIRLTRA